MSIGDPTEPASSAPAAVAPKCAWATLLTSEHLLPGLVVFAHSLLVQHSSDYPLVIMATSKLSSRARTILSTMLPSGKIVIRDIEPIYPNSTATGLAYTRFNEVWTKLRAFELVEYDRVALVDSDMLVLQNMDELFREPNVFDHEAGEEWIGASWACTCNPNRISTYPAEWIPENCGFTPQTLPTAGSLSDIPQPNTNDTSSPSKLINSGLVILTPSTTTMSSMISDITTSPLIPTYRFPDQDFLASFFSTPTRHIRYLPYIYNALKTLPTVHPAIWSDSAAKNIHYILDKPWTLGRPEEKDKYAQIHAWWWNAFDRVDSTRGGKGLRIDDEDWKDCVEKYMTLE
ncbi:hypothetical protein PHBOTO_004028 [Pseudozyma hubeiensis]|nr:hypothetical protein PHBOTO_004028 [Pseudozyma hubeiensis]